MGDNAWEYQRLFETGIPANRILAELVAPREGKYSHIWCPPNLHDLALSPPGVSSSSSLIVPTISRSNNRRRTPGPAARAPASPPTAAPRSCKHQTSAPVPPPALVEPPCGTSSGSKTPTSASALPAPLRCLEVDSNLMAPDIGGS